MPNVYLKMLHPVDAQCSKWHEYFDMEFSQKTEENPDQTTNPRTYFTNGSDLFMKSAFK